MTPDMFRKLQLKFGAAVAALKKARRIKSWEMGLERSAFEGKLADGSISTEAQTDAAIAVLEAKYAKRAKAGGVHDRLAEARARVAKRMAKIARRR